MLQHQGRDRGEGDAGGPMPFVVKLFHTMQDYNCLYFLMEVVSGGELAGVIDRLVADSAKCSVGTAVMKCSHAKFYLGCALLVLQALHGEDIYTDAATTRNSKAKSKIVYRDLKPENLMIAGNGYPKLVDYGFAKPLQLGERTFTLCGTTE